MHDRQELGIIECFGLSLSRDGGQSYNLFFDTFNYGFSVVQNGVEEVEWLYQDHDTLVGRSLITGETHVLVNPTPEFWAQHDLMFDLLSKALIGVSDK